MPDTLEDVKEEETPADPSPAPQEPAVPEEIASPATPAKPPKGFVPLGALHEERKKRQVLEEELQTLKSSVPSDSEVFSDEGKTLQAQITSLNAKLEAVEEEKNLERLYNQYPLLREKAEEFMEFRKAEHPEAKLESVAKLYLVENGLLEVPRKGLEKPTGGPRVPTASGMTAEEVDDLRKNDYKKYYSMLKKGQISIRR